MAKSKFIILFFLLCCTGFVSADESILLSHLRDKSEDESNVENGDKFGGKKVVCYYASWAVYREGSGSVSLDMIDPFLCTHLIYSFVGLNGSLEITSIDTWNDYEPPLGSKGSLKKIAKLRDKNPNLKVMVSVGGYNEGGTNFSRMAYNHTNRARFIKSALAFLKEYKLDGLDLDWQYPNFRGGRPKDRTNYIDLLREMKQAFEPHKYLLTATMPVRKDKIDEGYDVVEVAKYLEFMSLCSYDYHGAAGEPKTGQNAPLFSHDDEDPTLNVAWTVNYWLSLGAPREKLLLGLSFFARTYTLDQPKVARGLGAPASKPGIAGPYTQNNGTLTYQEVCLAVEKLDLKKVDTGDSHYVQHQDQWISFDDPKSLSRKVDFAKWVRLGGVMIWSIDQDDVNGSCSEGKNPLLNAVVRRLNSKCD